MSLMRQSKLFTKTRKEAPADEVSKNAELLIRAGFIHKEMAGVYSFLPLGLKVLNKIENIIREEMNKVEGVEMRTSVLQNKEVWEKTNRWDDAIVDNWFKTDLKNGGHDRDRTCDPLRARQMLSQLSYTPKNLYISI